ncbi:MAG TPA: hypothetical protein VFW00_07225 [Rhodocyclaceae bacterium]|nr:hypothetical protein [Rhodocyclaceae bacterium]
MPTPIPKPPKQRERERAESRTYVEADDPPDIEEIRRQLGFGFPVIPDSERE